MWSESGKLRAEKGAEALDAAGEDEVLALIEDGIAVRKIAWHFGVGRSTVYNWINAGGEPRRKRLEEARKRSAEALVDRAEEVLEDKASVETPQHAAMARELAKTLLWKAAKLDRATWGEQQQQVNVNLDFGQLHLAALQRAGNMSQQALPPTEPMPAEVVEDDE